MNRLEKIKDLYKEIDTASKQLAKQTEGGLDLDDLELLPAATGKLRELLAQLKQEVGAKFKFTPKGDLILAEELTALESLCEKHGHSLTHFFGRTAMRHRDGETTYLHARFLNLEDISDLNQLTELIDIDVAYNQISEISALTTLRNIDYLILDDNVIEDGSEFAGFEHLTEISVTHNPLDSISGMENLPGLESVRLDSKQASKKQIAKSIETLKSRGCQVGIIPFKGK